MSKWIKNSKGELINLDNFYKIKLAHSHGCLDLSIIGYLDNGCDVIIDHYKGDQTEQANRDYVNICSFLTM